MSGGTLRLIDYDAAAALSDISVTQEIATGNVGRLVNGPFSSTATVDPTSRAASVRLLWLTMADIQSSEAALIDLWQPLFRSGACELHGTMLFLVERDFGLPVGQ